MIHWWLCALLAGIGHTVKITMFALEKSKNRKVEKSKSSHARRFRLEKSKNSKKSKSRKVEKFERFEKFEKSKSRKLFGFLIFCENFPWKSDQPRGFIHAQGFLWLFGCSFPVEWLVTFQGSRKLAISVSELDFVLLM